MIGVYNYTVILTYLSLLSGGAGLFLLLEGRLYAAAICMMLSGLMDGFDGRVARTKKDRTAFEKEFGVQIDSLTDIVAFGVLPACIGAGLLKSSSMFSGAARPVRFLLLLPLLFYILAAMIRLAHFNATADEPPKVPGKKFYTGLPVTMASLIFPAILFLQHVTGADLTALYAGVALLVAVAFISPVKIEKPGLKGVLIMIGVGAAELILFFLARAFR